MKEGKKRLIPGAFIAKGRNSNKSIVFMRTTDKSYPVKALYSTTGLEVLSNQQTQKTIQAGARERLRKNVIADTKYTLEKMAEAVR